MPNTPAVPMSRRIAYAILAAIITLLITLFVWFGQKHKSQHQQAQSQQAQLPSPQPLATNTEDSSPTLLYAHNLELRKGPNFRVYIRWIRGQMLRTSPQIIPSFDDPDSFLLNLQKGVVDVKIADLSTYMGTVSPPGAPMQKISVAPDPNAAGNSLKISGTLHKTIPMPVEVHGTLTPAPTGFIIFHVNKISALKVPVKPLMAALHLTIADLMPTAGIPGIQVSDNDIIFDTQKLLPPPHIHGDITSLSTDSTNIKIIYGQAHDNEDRLAQWHNFLQLTGGTLSFGKVTMHQADLTLIDASKAQWFYLDLVKYQAQLTDSYTLMTAQQGLQVFMPDLDDNDPTHPNKVKEPVTFEWLRNHQKPIPTQPASTKGANHPSPGQRPGSER